MKHFFLAFQTSLYALLLILNPSYAQDVSAPEFDHERGFFEQGFQLSLTASEGNIYYTTDGSTPTSSNGSQYSSPIFISTSSVVRAVAIQAGNASSVETHSFIFLEDVIRQPNEISGWPNTEYPTDYKGNSAVMDYGMDNSIVDDPAYQDDLMKGLVDIPTICVSLDREDFWTMNDGWKEMQTSVEVMYPDDPSSNHQADGGIEGVSHKHQKRSYRLEFKSEYGPGKFKSDIMQRTSPNHSDNVSDKFDHLVLRAGTQRSWARNWVPNGTAFLRDQWYRDSQLAMSGFGSHGTYVHLYVNAVYFGLFNLAERPNDGFMEEYFGGDDEEWFVFNHNGDLGGDPSRWAYLNNELITKDLSNSNLYQEFKSYVNVPAFADYLIASWITGMVDWPGNNYYGGNRNEPEAEPMMFFAWDGEQAWDTEFGAHRGAWVQKDFRKEDVGGPEIAAIFNAVKHNDDFMIEFADRVYEHCFNDGPLTDENQMERWTILANYIEDAVVAESARWGDGLGDGITRTRNIHWRSAVEEVLQVMDGNVNRFMEALADEGYYPEIDPPIWEEEEGTIPFEIALTMINPNNSGTIYYRTDGGDPRLEGGQTAAEAQVYENALEISSYQTITARIKHGNKWSALRKGNISPVRPINDLFINEWMASNSQDTTDQSGKYEDWIELYNGDSIAVNIGGLFFTDDLNNPRKWQIPFTDPGKTTIPAGGFLLLWADEDTDEGVEHLDFKLKADGEVIVIFQEINSELNLVDFLSFGPQISNVSEGRYPDGSEDIRPFTISSPARSNQLPPVSNLISNIYINEFLAGNQTDTTDLNGSNEDWIELYNDDTVAVDVGGLYMTDDLGEPLMWMIPDDAPEQTIIPSKGFLLLWADKDTEDGPLHLDFKLGNGGEDIGLAQYVDGEVRWIDAFTFPAQTTDISYARLPDGGEEWTFAEITTPGASNDLGNIVYDCAGVPNGSAIIDSCGQCLPPDDPAFNSCIPKDTVLFIVGDLALSLGDEVVLQTVEEMGYIVEIVDEEDVLLTDTDSKIGILISSTVISSLLQDKLKDVAKPIMTWEPFLYDDMKMTGPKAGKDYGHIYNQTQLYFVPQTVPMIGGLDGLVDISFKTSVFAWGTPAETAISIAHITDNDQKMGLFAYKANDLMMDGFIAPDKRLGFFLHDNTAFTWSEEGKQIFEEAVCWLFGCNDVDEVNKVTAPTSHVVQIFPNPARQFVQIRWESQSTSPLEYELIDMFGKRLNKSLWPAHKGMMEEKLSFNKLSPGLYILKLRQGDTIHQEKLWINR